MRLIKRLLNLILTVGISFFTLAVIYDTIKRIKNEDDIKEEKLYG